jgi:hypothetical protein
VYRCCDHQRVECNRTGARRADWVTDKTARGSTAKKAAARAGGGGDGPLLGAIFHQPDCTNAAVRVLRAHLG